MIDGLLRVIGFFHPELSPLIDTALKHEADIEKLQPVIVAGISEGPGALAAAEKAAPDLAKAIKDYVNQLPGEATSSAGAATSIKVKSENVARMVIGHEPMSGDEEKAWLDRATPIEDSRQGSG